MTFMKAKVNIKLEKILCSSIETKQGHLVNEEKNNEQVTI